MPYILCFKTCLSVSEDDRTWYVDLLAYVVVLRIELNFGMLSGGILAILLYKRVRIRKCSSFQRDSA